MRDRIGKAGLILRPASVELGGWKTVEAGPGQARQVSTVAQSATATLTHTVANRGAEEVTREAGVGRMWVSERDACYRCPAFAGSVANVGGYFVPGEYFGDGRYRPSPMKAPTPAHDRLRAQATLGGQVLEEPRHRAGEMRRAADRARMASRLAVSNLGVADQPARGDAFADSVSVVAERLSVDLDLDLRPGVRLPAVHSVALVRIASEAVTSAARHCGSRRVSLSVERVGARTRMRVTDTGSGFDLAIPAAGFGLISMREHATSVGGDLRISSVPGQGTLVEAML